MPQQQTFKGVVGLVVAAGFSFRMKEFKPLLPLGELTAIERAVRCFTEAGLGDVRVVVGHRAAELQPKLEELGARAVVNEEYAKGMYTSIMAGVKSFARDVQAFLLLPVDMPLIRPQTVQMLVNTYRAGGAGIVYPCFDGERGHPPLISARYIPHILNFTGEGGLKALLEQYELDALEVDASDQGVLLDMDTPGDYQTLLKYRTTDGVPTEPECHALLRLARTPAPVIKHGQAVAKAALLLAAGLNGAGCGLDIKLIRAAGLLHDIAKGEPNHAASGALKLQAYPKLAAVIAVHTDIQMSPGQVLTEKEIIFLADKLVQEDKLVSLQERFRTSLHKFGQQPKVYAKISNRLQQAELIKSRVEQILAVPVEDILASQLGGEGQWTINS